LTQFIIALIIFKNPLTFLIFVGLPHFGYLYFSYFSMHEPEFGAGIDPAMALTHFHQVFWIR
jgi:hypothetical protein